MDFSRDIIVEYEIHHKLLTHGASLYFGEDSSCLMDCYYLKMLIDFRSCCN